MRTCGSGVPHRRRVVLLVVVILLIVLLRTTEVNFRQSITLFTQFADHVFKKSSSPKSDQVPSVIHPRVACSHPRASTGFALAKYYSSHMVLQRTPARPRIWGYADNIGDVILVEIEGVEAVAATATRGTAGRLIWEAVFRPLSGMGPYRIIVVHVAKNCHVTLVDVLVGDVWICSGQSNMRHPLQDIDNPKPDLDDAINYPKVRFLRSDMVMSHEPLEDLRHASLYWARPDKGARVGTFSAVCWLFGRNLWRKLQRPIGLVESSWDGSRIEAWSSPQALSVCFPRGVDRDVHFSFNNASVLWNAMIHPFIPMPIYGVVWYQGEQNIRNPHKYSCALKAMIGDWRAHWHEKSPQMDSVFPFGEVQLAPFRQLHTVIESEFPDVRWAQTGGYGYTPNVDFDKIFMAVAVDLPDFETLNPIHPRYKRQVADRLALAGLAVAYGRSDVGLYQGPIPFQVALVSNSVRLEYHVTIQVRQYQHWSGFELCCSSLNSDPTCGSQSSWTVTDIVGQSSFYVDLNNVCLGGARPNVVGVRYLWRESPCALEACAVYSVENKLPAPPYRANFEILQADMEAVGLRV